MPDGMWLWLPVGFFALQFSRSLWKKGDSQYPDTSELLIAAGIGFGAWRFGGDLWEGEWWQRIVLACLWWTAVTPVLRFLWLGRSGRVRTGFVRLLGFLVVWWLVTIASNTVLDLQQSMLAGVGAGFIVLFGPRWWRRLRSRISAWWEHRPSRREIRQTHKDKRRADRDWRRLGTRADKAEQQLEQAQEQIEALRTREADTVERLESLRERTFEQVCQAREWERRQIKDSDGGMVVHPSSFGFILLEAGRVLRHEIEVGERFPALEADHFLLEIAERLLESDDFRERYLHRQGDQVAEYLNQFFAAELSLGTVKDKIRWLSLRPSELAPLVLPGSLSSTLLEAWLVPQRRYQELQRQRYIQGQHRHQEVLTEWFPPGTNDYPPEKDSWRRGWDAFPAVFVHGGPLWTRDDQRQDRAPSRSWIARVRGWISR